MTTELDLHALRHMSELQAAQQLTALSTADLWAIVALRELKVARKAEKADLVAAVLAHTHPPREAPTVTIAFEQKRMF